MGSIKKRINSRSKVANIKATTYTNYINQYTARDTAGKGYGDLAARILEWVAISFSSSLNKKSNVPWKTGRRCFQAYEMVLSKDWEESRN